VRPSSLRVLTQFSLTTFFISVGEVAGFSWYLPGYEAGSVCVVRKLIIPVFAVGVNPVSRAAIDSQHNAAVWRMT
jgi:hypothetical protein